MEELPRIHLIQTLSPGASFTMVILVQESLFALLELHLFNALLFPSTTKTVSVDTSSVTTVVHWNTYTPLKGAVNTPLPASYPPPMFSLITGKIIFCPLPIPFNGDFNSASKAIISV